MDLWGAFVIWVFLVLIYGGFTAKDKGYKDDVQKYFAIGILICVVLAWLFNSSGSGGGGEDLPRPADIYNE